jgi:hypothetical protein
VMQVFENATGTLGAVLRCLLSEPFCTVPFASK